MRKISKIICLIVLLFSFSNSFCMQENSDEETRMINDGLGTLEKIPMSKGFYKIVGFLLGLAYDGVLTVAECLELLFRCYPFGRLTDDECEDILTKG